MKLLFVILTTITFHELWAVCGEGRPARHRLALSWNGNSNFVRYNAGVRAFHEHLANRMDRHFLGQGASRPQGNEPAKLSWAPEARGDQTVVLPATADGLQQVGRRLNEEVSRLRQQGVSADDIEFVFYVTNHGSKRLSGPNPWEYGINTRPSGRQRRAGADDTLWSNDLRQFASQVPRGIRVKAIFSQCFGADTSETFLSAVSTWDRCKCAIVKAEAGHPSWGTERADGGMDQDWSSNWDHQVIGSLERGGSLSEANSRVLWGTEFGTSPIGMMGHRDTGFSHAKNGNLTSSQLTLVRTLMQRFAARVPQISQWTSAQFLARANMLARGAAGQLSDEQTLQLKRRNQLRVQTAAQQGIDAELITRERQRLREFRPDKPFITDDALIAQHAFGQVMTPAELRRFLNARAAKFIVLQELLEEVFFKEATEQERARFLDQSACERDPIVAAAPPPQKAAPPEKKDMPKAGH